MKILFKTLKKFLIHTYYKTRLNLSIFTFPCYYLSQTHAPIKKTTYNPINQNSFSQIIRYLKSIRKKFPIKSKSNQNPSRVKKKKKKLGVKEKKRKNIRGNFCGKVSSDTDHRQETAIAARARGFHRVLTRHQLYNISRTGNAIWPAHVGSRVHVAEDRRRAVVA